MSLAVNEYFYFFRITRLKIQLEEELDHLSVEFSIGKLSWSMLQK